MENKELAKITGFKIVKEHGHRSFFLSFDLEVGGVQSFGGYELDEWNEKLERRAGSAAGSDMLFEIMRILNVEDLHDSKGLYCYVIRDQSDPSLKIIGIQRLEMDGGDYFLINDWEKDWFKEEES